MIPIDSLCFTKRSEVIVAPQALTLPDVGAEGVIGAEPQMREAEGDRSAKRSERIYCLVKRSEHVQWLWLRQQPRVVKDSSLKGSNPGRRPGASGASAGLTQGGVRG